MSYNLYCLDEQITEALCFYKAADFDFSQSYIAGKAPSMSGLTSSAVRLGNGSSAHGGRFAMKEKICKICGKEFIPSNNRQLTCSQKCGVINKRELTKNLHRENYKPKAPGPKICVMCGKEFIPAHGNIKTCSAECKLQARRAFYQKKHYQETNCLYCGIEFTPKYPNQKCCCEDHGARFYKQTYVANPRAKKYSYVCNYCGKEYRTHRKECDQYCSREHYELHRQQLAESKRQQLFAPVEAICFGCRKSYIRIRPNQKFCSMECANKFNLRIMALERIRQHQRKSYVCKECGITFVPLFGDKHRSYCSYKCLRKHMKRISTAVRNARIRKAGIIERFDPIEILERDRWTCQHCGRETPRELRGSTEDDAPELDHIIPIAVGGSHTQGNTQCLCRKCNINKGANNNVQ